MEPSCTHIRSDDFDVGTRHLLKTPCSPRLHGGLPLEPCMATARSPTFASGRREMRHHHRVQEWRVPWGAVNYHVLESLWHLSVDLGTGSFIDEVDRFPIRYHLTCLGVNLGEERLETLKRCFHRNGVMHQTNFHRKSQR